MQFHINNIFILAHAPAPVLFTYTFLFIFIFSVDYAETFSIFRLILEYFNNLFMSAHTHTLYSRLHWIIFFKRREYYCICILFIIILMLESLLIDFFPATARYAASFLKRGSNITNAAPLVFLPSRIIASCRRPLARLHKAPVSSFPDAILPAS